MKKLKKGERGFTLIEILVVVVLIGILTGGITATISQVLTINTRASNHMIAVRQVQQAGDRVSKDVLQAQVVDTENDPYTPELLTLTWTEFGVSANPTHEVIYTLEDMLSGELKILWREHYINSDLESTTKVAEYIDPAETSFIEALEGGAFIFTVTATVGGQSETREYKVKPRPDS